MLASDARVAPSSDSLEVLRSESELIDLAYVSGRATTALLKRQRGYELDDVDTSSICRVQKILKASAESQRFFETREGTLPEDAFAPHVDVTIQTASRLATRLQPAPSQHSDNQGMTLHEQIARYADSLNSTNNLKELIHFLTRLSESILGDITSIGEVIHDQDQS